jgi:hypothetical protein
MKVKNNVIKKLVTKIALHLYYYILFTITAYFIIILLKPYLITPEMSRTFINTGVLLAGLVGFLAYFTFRRLFSGNK